LIQINPFPPPDIANGVMPNARTANLIALVVVLLRCEAARQEELR
jgi:hypothetical protein